MTSATDPARDAVTRAFSAQRRAELTVAALHLTLDLGRAADLTVTEFPVTATWQLSTTATELVLDYLGEVDAVTVNGAAAQYTVDGGVLRIAELTPQSELEVTITGRSRYSRTGQGLHRFRDPVNGDTYLYSHCEPADARRIFPCCEQPSIKAPVTTTLIVPAAWRAFANGPLLRTEPAGEQTLRCEFATTPPLPSYLTAIAAGPYVGCEDSWVDQRHGGPALPLGAWCRRSMREYFDPEAILSLTKAGLDYFTTIFDSAFPWQAYHSIFVPEYNIGAMENPGLVTFTEAYIPRTTPTRAESAARTNTLLHEMSHMWFGDLVTPTWWDDLWLKESFAEYMGAAASVAISEHTDAWVNAAARRKAWALNQDQLPTTHPIAADIPDVQAARQNFDGITYAKGAAVLKQLVYYVGEEAFLAASRSYFAAHAHGTASFAELIAHLEAACGRSLTDWVSAWLQTSGVDHVSYQLTVGAHDTLELQLHNHGSCSPDGQQVRRPHRLQVGVWELAQGTPIAREPLDVELPLDAAVTTVDTGYPATQRDALLMVVNDHDHSYLVAQPDAQQAARLLQVVGEIPSPITRAVIWQQLWELTRDAALAPGEYLTAVLTHLLAESNATVTDMLLATAATAVESYLSGVEQLTERDRLAAGLWELLGRAEAGSDLQRQLALAYVPAATAAGIGSLPQLRELLAGRAGLVIDPRLRWAIATALSALGDLSLAEQEEFLAQDDTLQGQVMSFRTFYAAPLTARKDELLRQLLRPGALSNDEVKAGLAAWAMPLQQSLRRAAEADYFYEVNRWFAEHPQEIAELLIRGLYPTASLTDPEAAARALATTQAQAGAAEEDFDDAPVGGCDDGSVIHPVLLQGRAWLAQHADAPQALVRLIREAHDETARALRAQLAQATRTAEA